MTWITRSAALVAAACILICPARAGVVATTLPDGPLRPGLPGRVQVAAVDDRGLPSEFAPHTSVTAGTVSLAGAVEPGLWEWVVTPPPGATGLSLLLDHEGTVRRVALPVVPLPAPVLSGPPRLEVLAGTTELAIPLRGVDPPPPEAVDVVVTEGVVVGVEASPGGLVARVRLSGSRLPRVVGLGVRDVRRGDPPGFTDIVLKARSRVDLTTEPGARVRVEVGGRVYGPFATDGSGTVIDGWIEHFPGEEVARAVAADDVGNETVAVLELPVGKSLALVAAPVRGPTVGVWVHLHTVQAVEGPWTGPAPACRSPAVGELDVVRLGASRWVAPIVADVGGGDLRIRCGLRGTDDVPVRLPVVAASPAKLHLRVWPADLLSADFPVAEVQVLVEDARGERLDAQGVALRADLGTVRLDPGRGSLLRGEYDGTVAVDAGIDVVTATLVLPAGQGPVARLVVSHGLLPATGEVEVRGRALDSSARPLAGVKLELGVPGASATATTGSDGWATASLPVSDDPVAPVELRVATDYQEQRHLALRGTSNTAGPGQPDLVERHELVIGEGRVHELFVRVSPTVLYQGPGAFATVEVGLLDRLGRPVTTVPFDLDATAGLIGRPTLRDDGIWVAEYTPPPGDMAQHVDVVVRSGAIESRAALALEPRPITRALGLGVGGTTNLGVFTSPLLAVDLESRLPFLSRHVLLRAGLAAYWGGARVDTEFGEVRFQMVVVPLSVSALFRSELERGVALWVGGGVVAALHVSETGYGDGTRSSRFGGLPPGVQLVGGVGRRVPGGELMAEIRGLGIVSPGGKPGFRGLVGGVGALLGYRILW